MSWNSNSPLNSENWRPFRASRRQNRPRHHRTQPHHRSASSSRHLNGDWSSDANDRYSASGPTQATHLVARDNGDQVDDGIQQWHLFSISTQSTDQGSHTVDDNVVVVNDEDQQQSQQDHNVLGHHDDDGDDDDGDDDQRQNRSPEFSQYNHHGRSPLSSSIPVITSNPSTPSPLRPQQQQSPSSQHSAAALDSSCHSPVTMVSNAAGEFRRLSHTKFGRILLLANVRGNMSLINQLAKTNDAGLVIHTGDFGFYDYSSIDRIGERTIRHLLTYNNLINPAERTRLLASPLSTIRNELYNACHKYLSQFPSFLSGVSEFQVPVYVVPGVTEDLEILIKLRANKIKIPNLHLLDESISYQLEINGLPIRLYGLGGAYLANKLFDSGESRTMIAGSGGTTWTTALQIGQLLETAEKDQDKHEVRVLITHASPARSPLIKDLTVALHIDYHISAGLHFRHCVMYNDFSVSKGLKYTQEQSLEAQLEFQEIWELVQDLVLPNVDQEQQALLDRVLSLSRSRRFPDKKQIENDEHAYSNTWFLDLPDANIGQAMFLLENHHVHVMTQSKGVDFYSRIS